MAKPVTVSTSRSYNDMAQKVMASVKDIATRSASACVEEGLYLRLAGEARSLAVFAAILHDEATPERSRSFSFIAWLHPEGHRIFRVLGGRFEGRIAIADRSGPDPDQCEDGPLILNLPRPQIVWKEGGAPTRGGARVPVLVANENDRQGYVVLSLAESVALARELGIALHVETRLGESLCLVEARGVEGRA